MLKEIRCEVFEKKHQIIRFRNGLNVILGTPDGCNAIGKTLLLQVISFCFGGDAYMSESDDIRDNVGNHTVYFTLEYNGEEMYFYRNTENKKFVCRCDKAGNQIEEICIRKYREFISTKEGLDALGITIKDCEEHFFRIYGGENIQERYPLFAKRREREEEAVDFLMKLFGYEDKLEKIQEMEEVIGVRASDFKISKDKEIPEDRFKSLETEIAALKERRNTLINGNDNAKFSVLGLNNQSREKAETIQREMRTINANYNSLVEKRNAILAGNERFCNEVVEQDLNDLQEFFPDINMKSLEDIQNFHIKIREILAKEAQDEAQSLTKSIEECEHEYEMLSKSLEKIGYADELLKRMITEGVSIARAIEEKETEKAELIEERERLDGIRKAEEKMAAALTDMQKAMRKMQKTLNDSMEQFNTMVTSGQENAPLLRIGNDKTVYFGTEGNTSESTAFKSLVLYDLTILKETSLPALIHDSIITKSINRAYVEKLLQLYELTEKQSFVVFDHVDNADDEVKEILDSAKVITLSKDHRLYGRSWANKKIVISSGNE